MKAKTIFVFLMIGVSNVNAQGNFVGLDRDQNNNITYIVRMDEATMDMDTVCVVNADLNSDRNVIDPINNRYIFHWNGTWQLSGLRVVDINNGTVDTILKNAPASFAYMQYDPVHNRLVCRNNTIQKLTTFDLGTHILDTVNINLPSTDVGGLGPYIHHAYDPVHERYLYIHISGQLKLAYIDLAGDSVISNVPLTGLTPPSLHYDESENKYYGIVSPSDVVSIDPLTGILTYIASIPNSNGNLNGQQVVYDQINNRMVAPYYSTTAENRIAFVDVISGQIYISDTFPAMIEFNQVLNNSVIITDTTQSMLKAPVAQAYQWYRNDTAISGATNQIHNVTQPGNYFAELTFSSHTGKSNVIQFSALSIGSMTSGTKVTVSPNPFSRYAELHFDYHPGSIYRMSITDLSGKQVSQIENITSGSFKLHRADLVPGIYTFDLTNGKEVITGKLQVD